MNNNRPYQTVRITNAPQDISETKKPEDQLPGQFHTQKTIAEAIIQAQDAERSRIGHELHEIVNQILSTTRLYLSSLDPHMDNFAEIKKKSLETILSGMEEIRLLLKEMVMPVMKGEGLLAGIKNIVYDPLFIDMFTIQFTHSKQRDLESLSENKKITLYRIVQEQFRNIIKHSKAKNVEVELENINNQIRLSIVDDGIGFDCKNTARGPGLSGIFERTRLNNGKIILKTSPGYGCSLLVNIPDDDKHIFSQSPGGRL